MDNYEDDYTDIDVEDIDFDVDEMDDPYDYILERQELEDFAQDGYFENMEPIGDGNWG